MVKILIMGTKSKDRFKDMIVKDFLDVHQNWTEAKKSINDHLENTISYLQALIDQIPESTSRPLITKTPKILKKRGKKIETILENHVFDTDYTMSESNVSCNTNVTITNEECNSVGRGKRQASQKATDNIRKQQSFMRQKKLRRGSPENFDETYVQKKVSDSHGKRKKSVRRRSDEDDNMGSFKQSKIEENVVQDNLKEVTVVKMENNKLSIEVPAKPKREKTSITRKRSSRKRSLSHSPEPILKRAHIIDDTVLAPTMDDVQETSLYEDALGKPTPVMNSTMKINTMVFNDKIMNATVVLEPLNIKLNETVTITKNSMKVLNNSLKRSSQKSMEQAKIEITSPKYSKTKILPDKIEQIKAAMANKEFDDLLTDDESSPDVKKPKKVMRKADANKGKRNLETSSSSDDEVLNTRAKKSSKEANPIGQNVRSKYKSNALFSPYAKESVKKRVEAFEQAGMSTPKSVDDNVPTRMTRTKIRAMMAAKTATPSEALDITKVVEKTVTQQLARKSLARAKKISLAKHIKDEESKENKSQIVQKINHVLSTNTHNQKQQKTPLGKSKLHIPVSVNRNYQTPNTEHAANRTRPLTASRTNIITSVDSFIQAPRTVGKTGSTEKIEEKKRKMNDEDARKKREEALRLQTEEKRKKRQEKELKNKLAREAKEKQELEKRQKAEKEKEEKARLVQQMLDKQREEMEKKRLAQLQRAQEKEERRRQEEHQRLVRLQELEEAERLLTEQRRREQEADRRKEAEARAQHQAAAEAMKLKNQIRAAQGKYANTNNKHQGPTNYVLDSEPDDEESDDESKPKHIIPHWAQTHVRKTQLAIQRYIPQKVIFKFFDTRKCTPDLTVLFDGIDRSRLKRTSSAIWKTPPRYSMMEAE
ncbi:hypothetical protein KM043_013798 [Ampulex compressa]|nr:hypothetical protein KM043_013798 [Ampulex compressa]